MKTFITIPFFLLFFLSFSACGRVGYQSSPEESIVEMWKNDFPVGKGVLLPSGMVATARHVIASSGSYQIRTLEGDSFFFVVSSLSGSDLALLTVSGNLDRGWSDICRDCLMTGSHLWALVSRSGSWVRLDGEVLNMSVAYMGYDDLFNAHMLTGIETDLVLYPGESGSPVWTSSGALIGIVSAIDKEGKKGYVAPLR